MLRATRWIAPALVTAAALCAQDRSARREALRAWSALDPALEKDAATTGPGAGPGLAARVEKIAPAAASYAAALGASYNAAKEDAERQSATPRPILVPGGSPSVRKALDGFISSQTNSLAGSLSAIGQDPDRGLQRLRQALERERAALSALAGAIKSREAAEETIAKQGAIVDQALAKSNEIQRGLARSFEQAAQAALDQQSSFADYYRLLLEAVRGAPATRILPASPISPALVSTAPSAPVAQAATRPMPPVPLSRYVGAWTYNAANPVFHGAEPESADLAVREDNGQVNGNLYVRFKTARGISQDAVVRFDFSGALQTTRTQTFDLVTAEGLKGKVELIPGPAFNLLEMVFETDRRPGKVRQGNFILVKK